MTDQRNKSFTAMLFRLMNKADSTNFARLAKAFPQEANEYVRWLRHSDGEGH